MPVASTAGASRSGGNTFSLLPSSKSTRLLLHHHHHRCSKLKSSAEVAADDDDASDIVAISSTPQDVWKTNDHPSETKESFACCCTPALDVLPTANEFEIPVTSEAVEHYSIPSFGEFDYATPPTPATETSVCMVVSNQELHEDVEVIDRHREYNNASNSSNRGAAGFTTSSLYLAIFNLLAETASSLHVLHMALVEIDDEDMKVLFNLAMRCHTLHLRVHVYLAIFNLHAETASSLQVQDMPFVEIDDEDMRVLFNLATHYHTFRICKSMKIDQTLPFLKATIHPRL